MCGIFGYIGRRKNAAQIAFEGIKQLEYRGYDSWGVAFIDQKKLGVEKHAGKIGSAVLHLAHASALAIGHTRWATHGGVTVQNAHPHLDTAHRIAVVHNGIVENYAALKETLTQKGFVFQSQTDTEVIVHLIANHLRTLQFGEAVRQSFLQLKGLSAFVVIDAQTQTFAAVRKGSPLAVGKDKTGFFVASDPSAMGSYTQQVYFMDDGEMMICTKEKAILSDANTGRTKKITWQKLSLTSQDLSKGSYDHFMLKEIMEQPKIIDDLTTTAMSQISSYAKHIGELPLFTGCGSAYHASLTYTYLLATISHRRSSAVIGSELGFQLPLVKDVFISFISQSGESIDIIEHMLELKKEKIQFGAIVNRLGSTLERATQIKILLNAGPEQCVLATKSFTAKLAVGILLAHALNKTVARGQQELKNTVKELSKLLQNYNAIKSVAAKLIKGPHMFIIGRGLSYPIALEGALKIKESTYLHAEGFAGGDLKHGPIALIEKGTPCIVLAPSDDTYNAIISNAMEMKSRGAHVIGITEHPNEVFDVIIPIKNTGTGTIITQSVIFQLLAYEMCLLLGTDPDKPRNLAKSVVVK